MQDDQLRVKNKHAQALGKLGGKAGKGKRTEDCRRAALIRWAKVKEVREAHGGQK
jgi:hypothetical protein